MTESRHTPTLFNAHLRLLPTQFKLLFTAVLWTLATGYLFALTNLALSVGLDQAKVVEHYWGNQATQEELKARAEGAAPAASSSEEMSFDDLETAVPTEPIVAVPSFSSLVAEGHFHLFGYTFIFFLCALIISFAELDHRLRNTLILAPFVASVFDIWSILLTRFVGPGFSWLLMASGTVMGLSFGAVFVISNYQMWLMKAPTQGEMAV